MESKEIRFKAGIDVQFISETTDANIFKCIVQPGSRTPIPHYHEKFDETVKGIKGITTLRLDDKTFQIGPGDSVTITRGAVHQIANKTHETIEFLCEVSPGVFGYNYFRDIEPLVNAPGLPDIESLKSVMKNHGLVPVIGVKQSLVFGVIGLIRRFKKQ